MEARRARGPAPLQLPLVGGVVGVVGVVRVEEEAVQRALPPVVELDVEQRLLCFDWMYTCGRFKFGFV